MIDNPMFIPRFEVPMDLIMEDITRLHAGHCVTDVQLMEFKELQAHIQKLEQNSCSTCTELKAELKAEKRPRGGTKKAHTEEEKEEAVSVI